MTREIFTSLPVMCLCFLLKWYKCLVWMEFDKWNAAWREPLYGFPNSGLGECGEKVYFE